MARPADWFSKLTPEQQQAWRDKLASVPQMSHADCTHEQTKLGRDRCRRARRREAAKAGESK